MHSMLRFFFELQRAFKQIASDESVRVVVLTGEGKAFSAGQDLKAAGDPDKINFNQIITERYNPLIKAMRNLPKPIICRLNGVAAGAGCSLALACDLIIAAEEAYLAEIFINIALVMDAGSTYFLPRQVGSLKAFELATMGPKVTGKEAESLGLVNKAVPMEQLDETVAKYVAYYETAPTKAVGLIKKMLQKSSTSTLEEVLAYEALCQQTAGQTSDFREGVRAFLEKRKPSFQGK